MALRATPSFLSVPRLPVKTRFQHPVLSLHTSLLVSAFPLSTLHNPWVWPPPPLGPLPSKKSTSSGYNHLTTSSSSKLLFVWVSARAALLQEAVSFPCPSPCTILPAWCPYLVCMLVRCGPFPLLSRSLQCSAPAHLPVKLSLALPTFSALSFSGPPVSSAPFILSLTHALASFPDCLCCAFFLVGGWLLRAENTCFPFLKLLSPQHHAVPLPGVWGDAV